jgi:SulP family sulfate permease
MIVINGLDPLGVFFCVGLYYIFSGAYFRVTMPVEPMKVIGAYAIATGIGASQVAAAGALIGCLLLILGASGAMTLMGRYIPTPVVRGVQLSTGVLLISQGVKLMIGRSAFQILREAAEPYLSLQTLGFLPIGTTVGIILAIATLFLLDNKRVPAALVIVFTGLLIGIFFGSREGLNRISLGFHFPPILPLGIPSGTDFWSALIILTIPQLPMTLGNAVVANADLSKEYFGKASKRVSYKALCISMALANIGSFFLGGMPMCHGAGGLASRYRFGARTAGSNIIIGLIFLILALLFGKQFLYLVYLIPMSVLGVLLLFAGSQLALTLLDMRERKDLFVPLMVVGITLATNLAVGFLAGIAIAYLLRSDKLRI